MEAKGDRDRLLDHWPSGRLRDIVYISLADEADLVKSMHVELGEKSVA